MGVAGIRTQSPEFTVRCFTVKLTTTLSNLGSNEDSLDSKSNVLPITPLDNLVLGTGIEPVTYDRKSHVITTLQTEQLYLRQDSNLYVFRLLFLRQVCLPIPPLRHSFLSKWQDSNLRSEHPKCPVIPTSPHLDKIKKPPRN
jgi:hypothetical protein